VEALALAATVGRAARAVSALAAPVVTAIEALGGRVATAAARTAARGARADSRADPKAPRARAGSVIVGPDPIADRGLTTVGPDRTIGDRVPRAELPTAASAAILDLLSSGPPRGPDLIVKLAQSRIARNGAIGVTAARSERSVAAIAASAASVARAVKAGHGRTADPVPTDRAALGGPMSRVGLEAIGRQRPPARAKAHNAEARAWT
jgi:hypothetical protein